MRVSTAPGWGQETRYEEEAALAEAMKIEDGDAGL